MDKILEELRNMEEINSDFKKNLENELAIKNKDEEIKAMYENVQLKMIGTVEREQALKEYEEKKNKLEKIKELKKAGDNEIEEKFNRDRSRTARMQALKEYLLVNLIIVFGEAVSYPSRLITCVVFVDQCTEIIQYFMEVEAESLVAFSVFQDRIQGVIEFRQGGTVFRGSGIGCVSGYDEFIIFLKAILI